MKTITYLDKVDFDGIQKKLDQAKKDVVDALAEVLKLRDELFEFSVLAKKIAKQQSQKKKRGDKTK